MDTLSHGLWGGLVFGRGSRKDYALSFSFGVLPDLLSFGPFFLAWAVKGFPRFPGHPGEPPDPSLIPAYVHHAYDVTHSALVWTAVFAIAWAIRKKPPRTYRAWLLHILCDIPTHTRRFFPTPFLWPLPTPYVNGIRWGQPWFMVLNYSFLAAGYAIWVVARRRRN